MRHNHVCGSGLKMICGHKFRAHFSSPHYVGVPTIGPECYLQSRAKSSTDEASIIQPLPNELGSTAPSPYAKNLLIIIGTPMLSFDELCCRVSRFNEVDCFHSHMYIKVTGSAFVYSHGMRFQVCDEQWTKSVFKSVAYVCVRAGSDSITCKVSISVLFIS